MFDQITSLCQPKIHTVLSRTPGVFPSDRCYFGVVAAQGDAWILPGGSDESRSRATSKTYVFSVFFFSRPSAVLVVRACQLRTSHLACSISP